VFGGHGEIKFIVVKYGLWMIFGENRDLGVAQKTDLHKGFSIKSAKAAFLLLQNYDETKGGARKVFHTCG
jgi:hypothetical protein